jgi:hypothetical protein
LFRDEASLQLRSKLSSSLAHPGLRGSSGLLLLLGFSLCIIAALSFVPVSLGVTAPGVLRLTEGSQPVIAERTGVLTYVLSEREQNFISQGTVLASIRNLDLAVSRNVPNSAFTLRELEERLNGIDTRLAEIAAYQLSQKESFTAMRASLEDLLTDWTNWCFSMPKILNG